MKCTNCGAEVSDNAKYCPECGRIIERKRFCPQCGAEISGGKFCPECGALLTGESGLNTHENECQKEELQTKEKHGNVQEIEQAETDFNRGVECFSDDNFTEAVKWFRKAAEHGHAKAQYFLALFYENGTGVPKDLTEAVKWFRKAAEQGNAYAQFNLGECYFYGKGVDQSYVDAIAFYILAAEQGNANAQNKLGICHDFGYGVEKKLYRSGKMV